VSHPSQAQILIGSTSKTLLAFTSIDHFDRWFTKIPKEQALDVYEKKEQLVARYSSAALAAPPIATVTQEQTPTFFQIYETSFGTTLKSIAKSKGKQPMLEQTDHLKELTPSVNVGKQEETTQQTSKQRESFSNDKTGSQSPSPQSVSFVLDWALGRVRAKRILSFLPDRNTSLLLLKRFNIVVPEIDHTLYQTMSSVSTGIAPISYNIKKHIQSIELLFPKAHIRKRIILGDPCIIFTRASDIIRFRKSPACTILPTKKYDKLPPILDKTIFVTSNYTDFKCADRGLPTYVYVSYKKGSKGTRDFLSFMKRNFDLTARISIEGEIDDNSAFTQIAMNTGINNGDLPQEAMCYTVTLGFKWVGTRDFTMTVYLPVKAFDVEGGIGSLLKTGDWKDQDLLYFRVLTGAVRHSAFDTYVVIGDGKVDQLRCDFIPKSPPAYARSRISMLSEALKQLDQEKYSIGFYGPKGMGKTTVFKRLCEERGIHFIEPDDIIKEYLEKEITIDMNIAQIREVYYKKLPEWATYVRETVSKYNKVLVGAHLAEELSFVGKTSINMKIVSLVDPMRAVYDRGMNRGDPLSKILLEQRLALFVKSHHTLSSGDDEITLGELDLAFTALPVINRSVAAKGL